MLTDNLILTRTVGEEAFWMLWRHYYDVTRSHNIIGKVTIRLPFGTFIQTPNKKESGILMAVGIFSLKYYEIYDFITSSHMTCHVMSCHVMSCCYLTLQKWTL